ncbi:MAG: glycosyltransferase family 4 protein [Bacteroidales bacterium]|nr:glycosyltransferase family 4 protein [Bacteroidales bacterium]
MDIIIVSPSLDTTQNVSGISSVTQFIIDKNPSQNYIHFEQGKKDNERGGVRRILPIITKFREWKNLLSTYPDAIIHYNFPLSKVSIIRDVPFIKYAQLKKRKIVIHLHGGVYLTSEKTPTYLNAMLKTVFGKTTPIVALSQLEKNAIESRYDVKDVSVLPNCVDVKEQLPIKAANDKPLTFGYIGRITKEKGIAYLLEACKTLKGEGVEFNLILAGKEDCPNEFIPRFKESLGDLFIYEGVVSGNKKEEFLNKLDVFILPSFFEGLPMSLLECMACGIVPLTTNVGSIADVVDNGKNGIFIKVKDSETIHNAICQLNNDREMLGKMSEAAHKTILSKFSPQEYIKELNSIYNRL